MVEKAWAVMELHHNAGNIKFYNWRVSIISIPASIFLEPIVNRFFVLIYLLTPTNVRLFHHYRSQNWIRQEIDHYSMRM